MKIRFYEKILIILIVTICFSLYACDNYKNPSGGNENLQNSNAESKLFDIYDFSSENNIYKISSQIVDFVEGEYINIKPISENYRNIVLDAYGHAYTCTLLSTVDTESIIQEYGRIVEKHVDEIVYLDDLMEKGYIVQYFSGKVNENVEYEIQIDENQSETTVILKVIE